MPSLNLPKPDAIGYPRGEKLYRLADDPDEDEVKWFGIGTDKIPAGEVQRNYLRGIPTGEFRVPKKGEWYLGLRDYPASADYGMAIPEVWKANSRSSSEHFIMRLVRVLVTKDARGRVIATCIMQN